MRRSLSGAEMGRHGKPSHATVASVGHTDHAHHEPPSRARTPHLAAVAAAGGEVVAPPGAAPGPVRVPEPAGDATGDSPVAGGVDDVVEVDDVEFATVCEDIGVRRA